MVEPTESEPKVELDRFVDALIAIRARFARSRPANRSRQQSAKTRPPLADLLSDSWDRPYARGPRRLPDGGDAGQ